MQSHIWERFLLNSAGLKSALDPALSRLHNNRSGTLCGRAIQRCAIAIRGGNGLVPDLRRNLCEWPLLNFGSELLDVWLRIE